MDVMENGQNNDKLCFIKCIVDLLNLRTWPMKCFMKLIAEADS